MKKLILVGFAVSLAALAAPAGAQTDVAIPDIPGYRTLKCDFHIHSVFSDGLVWPTVRIAEAKAEGLDAISLSEHIEYRPHHASGDMTSTHGRSHDITVSTAEKSGVMLIRGSEITRGMAPGHANAIFLENSDALAVDEWRDSYAEARRQGAFIFWNHPRWEAQQRDETLWWPEHTELYEKGLMDGIEIVNGKEYSPEAHQWCLDKNLTMLGSTDVHSPIQWEYDYPGGEHRSMTLVFAAERTPEALHEALRARRTAVWFDELIVGRPDILKALFESSVEIVKVTPEPRRVTVEWRNNSGLTFRLRKTASQNPALDYMPNGQMTIPPHGSGSFTIRFPEGAAGDVNFEVTNLLTAPGRGLELSYPLP
jgi:hypothetical protein